MNGISLWISATFMLWFPQLGLLFKIILKFQILPNQKVINTLKSQIWLILLFSVYFKCLLAAVNF